MTTEQRAVGYLRVSTGRQAEDGNSLGEQEARITAWAAREGYELTTFRDAITGRRDDRDALDLALADLASTDAFVVAKFDRLGRSARYLLEMSEAFDHHDVRFVALSDGIDTATNAGKMILRFLAVIAETESDNIAERNRMAAASLFRLGRYNGPAPYGYRFEDAELVEVSHEAEVVRRVFAAYLAGASLSSIARGLNADGVTTKRGGIWRQGTLSPMVRNPVYAGQIRSGEEVAEGSHEPIIDRVTFDAAQQLAEARAVTRSKGRGRPTVAPHLFIAGTLRCGECGEAMTPHSRRRPHYRCAGCQQLGCTMPMVHREVIDGAVYAYFEQVGLDVEATREAIAHNRDAKLREVRALLEEARHEAQRSAERLARVRRDYTDGKIDADDWRSFRAELESEHAAATAEVDRLELQVTEVESWAKAQDAERETLDRLAQIRATIIGEVQRADGVEAVRAALARMFEGFTLHRAGSPSAPRRLHAELAAVPGFLIESHVRAQAIDHDGRYAPILRREPLEQAVSPTGINHWKGVGQWTFMPILVECV